ncbi:hypothetical protein [Hydrogenophaga taeniospiralis]|nr:hypothetical protein [Hydrogenophaga taeniospiralis]
MPQPPTRPMAPQRPRLATPTPAPVAKAIAPANDAGEWESF